jgi:hypothetical protein
VGNQFFLVTANGIPLCKVGYSIHPPDRHAEAIGESSTWHPEEFTILFFKWVPNMKVAEDKVHAFFQEQTVLPAYPKGGVEWILAQPDRVRYIFEALEGGPVLETVEDLVRPPPVPREAPPLVKVATVNMSYIDWRRLVAAHGLATAEEYTEWQSTHPEAPTLPDLLTGCFQGITNYNSLTEGLFGRSGRQR